MPLEIVVCNHSRSSPGTGEAEACGDALCIKYVGSTRRHGSA